MRTENEMMELIIDTAKKDERIRAAVLNGSRANDFILHKDKYQDYDIVYFVNDLQYFIDNKNYVDIFGERIMLEMPCYKDSPANEYNGYFNYQMLFTDGNRIDLTFASLDKVNENSEEDNVGLVLLDKDNLFANISYDNGKTYFIMKPTKRDFENKCNSFWWCTQNIAKGIKRKELPYVMTMFNWVREQLDDMVSWYIGMCHEYKVSSGKMGKYFEKYLENSLWEKYVSTFPTGEYDAIWSSLFSACELFRHLATKIADKYSYDYPHQDDKLMTEYLTHLQKNEPSIPKSKIFPEPITKFPKVDMPFSNYEAYLSQGENHQIIFMHFNEDIDLPEHSHESQWGIVLEGKIWLTIDGEANIYTKGDRYFIGKGVKHSGKIFAGYADMTFFNQKDRYGTK